MDDLPPELSARARHRDGVLTRTELHDTDVTDARIHWMVSRRRWQLLLPGIVLLSPVPPTRRQQVVSALLLGGPGAVIGGPAAARFHGVTGIPASGPVHVLTPRSRARRRHRWADVRPTRLEDPDVVATELVRYSGVARSVVDAAMWAPSQGDAEAWTIEAVQRGLVDVEDLTAWVYRLNRRWSARPRRALEAAATGAWSRPEVELLELVDGSRRLPEAWLNPELCDERAEPLLTPDAWFDDVAMAVMVHSREFHEGSDAWNRTVSGDSELTAHGIVVVGVTPRGIRREPAVVLDRIERAHVAAQQRPRPPVVATPRALARRSA